jgi:hypothetical protein
VETGNAMEPVQSTDQSSRRSFFTILGGVYSSPGATFKDIGRTPTVLIPMIVLVILGAVTSYCLSLKVDVSTMAIEAMVEPQVARGNMTQAQADQLLERAANRTVAGTIVGSLASGLTAVLIVLILASVAKLISSTFLGAENRFKSLFSVTLYVSVAVGIIYTVLFLIILYFKDPSDLTLTTINSLVASNLGAMMSGVLGEDALPKFLARFLSWVDIFAIWRIALLSIGYSAVSRKLKTATAATWIMSIYIVIALIAAAISPIFGR